MHTNPIISTSKTKVYQQIDWSFLLFLTGAVYVKSYVKIAAIVLYFIWLYYKKATFNFRLVGPIKFYIALPIIAFASALLSGNFGSNGYWFGFSFGLLQWGISLFAFFLLYVSIANIDRTRLLKTVDAFFVINFFVCILQLGKVMVDSGSVMPYWVFDAAEKYGTSTGDNIYGVFGNNSIANSAISTVAGIYFVAQKQWKIALACFFVMLLCTSNLSLATAILALSLLIVFWKDRETKKQAILSIVFMAAIYPILSVANIKYIENIFGNMLASKPTYTSENSASIDSGLRTQRLQDSLKSDSLHTETQTIALPFSFSLQLNKQDTVSYLARLAELGKMNELHKDPASNVRLDQRQLKNSFELIYGLPVEHTPLATYSKPGKIYSYLQTIDFVKRNFAHALLGAGMGNFSSKLALKMTCLKLQGNYPSKYLYASPSFMEGHMYATLYFLSQNIALHSILNLPYSIYNQLLGEYGILGLLAFGVWYIGYFLRHGKRAGYGWYIILAALIFFNVEYWFEMGSLTIIFELFLLMDLKAPDKTNE